jgi:hypothetical protein
VIAGSADEARQVVLDNADRVLKDLLSKKFPSGKRVLPPKSALPVEAKHIGAVDDGTMKGQITTSRPITMLSPQGPMTVMLDAGNIVDVERDVEEGSKPSKKEYLKKLDQNRKDIEDARKQGMYGPPGSLKNVKWIKKGVAEDIKQIDELSPEKLSDYKKKATKDSWRKIMQGDFEKGDKRLSGVVKATDRLTKDEAAQQGVAEGEGGFDIEDMVMDMYYNGGGVWEIAQYLGIGEDEVQDIIDSNEKGVAEGSKMAKHDKLAKAPKPKNQQEYDAIEKYKADLAKSYRPKKEQGVSEADAEKIGGRYDPEEFDQMVLRLKTLAGAGPLKTVWDPEKRVYRNVPINQPQDKK